MQWGIKSPHCMMQQRFMTLCYIMTPLLIMQQRNVSKIIDLTLRGLNLAEECFGLSPASSSGNM
jgi:hypothetical protein